MRTYSANVTPRLTVLFVAGSLFLSLGALAQGATPFERLAGEWSGSGTIDLANGGHEPIKCHAAYDVLGEQNNLQLNIRCASDSYNFDLRGSATYANGSISDRRRLPVTALERAAAVSVPAGAVRARKISK
jgi:hypothetical protein